MSILSADALAVSQHPPLFKPGSRLGVEGGLAFRAVYIDSLNVDRSLTRRKARLSRLHGELLELYLLHLRSENRSPETQYCALYRADKFLRWLEFRGEHRQPLSTRR